MFTMPLGFMWSLPASIQWGLASIVQFFFGASFYHSAWSALKSKALNMEVLVSLGTSCAYFLSVYFYFQNRFHELYFESSSMIISFVLLGKYLEKKAKQKTKSALEGLFNLAPKTCVVFIHGKEVSTPVSELNVGDQILLRAGERSPIDGTILEGESHFDESSMTGESKPVSKSIHDQVVSGTLNLDGRVVVEAKKVGKNSTLSQVIELMEKVHSKKSPIQKTVDRVSSIFVPTVLMIALLTLMGTAFLFHLSLEESLLRSVSILVIACPCALGLATPTALVRASGIAAQNGVLIRDFEVLETIHSITSIAFDKTGTLTKGKPKLTKLEKFDPQMNEDQILQIALSLQSGSSHPLSEAIKDASSQKNLTSHPIQNQTSLPGIGVEGVVQNKKYLLGNKKIFKNNPNFSTPDSEEKNTSTHSYLVDVEKEKCLARFSFEDQIRPEAKLVILKLQKDGYKTYLLTGDTKETAEKVSHELGMNQFWGELYPQEKLEKIESLKKTEGKTAMIGDGINDAPSLASADLSISMSSGTEIAMHASQVTLMREDLHLVGDTFEIIKKTRSKIHQNLFWAFFYNTLGIPLAALGYLSPMIAGAAMALSSVSVVLNSLSIRFSK